MVCRENGFCQSEPSARRSIRVRVIQRMGSRGGPPAKFVSRSRRLFIACVPISSPYTKNMPASSASMISFPAITKVSGALTRRWSRRIFPFAKYPRPGLGGFMRHATAGRSLPVILVKGHFPASLAHVADAKSVIVGERPHDHATASANICRTSSTDKPVACAIEWSPKSCAAIFRIALSCSSRLRTWKFSRDARQSFWSVICVGWVI